MIMLEDKMRVCRAKYTFGIEQNDPARRQFSLIAKIL